MTSLVYQQNATCIYILVHGVYSMVKRIVTYNGKTETEESKVCEGCGIDYFGCTEHCEKCTEKDHAIWIGDIK